MLTPEMVWNGYVKAGDRLRHKSGVIFTAQDFIQPINVKNDMVVLFERKRFYLLSECELADNSNKD